MNTHHARPNDSVDDALSRIAQYKAVVDRTDSEYVYLPDEGEDEDGNAFGEIRTVSFYRLEGPKSELSQNFAKLPEDTQQEVLELMYQGHKSFVESLTEVQKKAQKLMETWGNHYHKDYKTLLNLNIPTE